MPPRRRSVASKKSVTFVPVPKVAGKRNHAAHIARFHMLNKRLAAARQSGDPKLVAELDAALESMGGLAAYQAASRRGEAQQGGVHNTAKWVVAQLMALGRRPAVAAARKLRLLDVGALSANYPAHASWIAPRAIDLRASAPGVEAIDFFDFTDDALFDVVVLSLVINFVGDPHARGRMLHKAACHLPVGGVVFVVLPLACVDRSRYCDEAVLVDLAQSCGLTSLVAHRSKSLFYAAFEVARQLVVLGFYILSSQCGCIVSVSAKALPSIRRCEVRSGAGFNSFCILLGSTS